MTDVTLAPEVWLHDRPAKQLAIQAGGKQIFVSYTREPVWLQPTLERMRHLLELVAGWDSYGAAAVSSDAVYHGLSFLSSTASHDTPPPAVIPGASGEIQIEWHREGLDIEIGVDPSGDLSAFFQDERTGEQWEEAPLIDAQRIRAALRTLTERATTDIRS